MFNPKFLLKSKFNIKKAHIYEKAYHKILELNLFDETFYKNNYSEYEGDALQHYLFEGYKKNYDPSLNFNTYLYLKNYPDVQKASINPLVHYALYGIKENRTTFHSNFYMKEYILNTNLLYLNNYEFENKPLVSIIVLNKNGLKHLKRLFEDFSKKTNYPNFEVILVDNDSEDESVDYVKSLNLDFPITIIENDENLSFSKANNEACKIANGEYVLFLNNDMETTYGWLNEMMGTMINNENVGAVGAKLIFPANVNNHLFKIQHSGDILSFHKKKSSIYAYHQNEFVKPFDNEVNTLKKVISVTAAALLMKKSIFDEIDGFDEGYIYGYEDVDLALKLNKAGYDIWYCHSAVLFHHESSTRKVSENFENNSSRLNSKWWNYLNKNIYLDKINNNKFFCEQPLKFLFIVDDINDIYSSVSKLAKKFMDKSYVVGLAVNSEDIIIDGSVDIIVSFTDKLDENVDIRENTIKILFLEDDTKINNDFYDIIINNDVDNLINILKEFILSKYCENTS